nr:hypothetical protein [Tessaracoccus coleopterorum]
MTIRDGSLISSRRPISSENALCQARPKWMLWCAVTSGGVPRTPRCHTAADGE